MVKFLTHEEIALIIINLDNVLIQQWVQNAHRMAIREDPDQTASDLGLDCLHRPVCPKN